MGVGCVGWGGRAVAGRTNGGALNGGALNGGALDGTLPTCDPSLAGPRPVPSLLHLSLGNLGEEQEGLRLPLLHILLVLARRR